MVLSTVSTTVELGNCIVRLLRRVRGTTHANVFVRIPAPPLTVTSYRPHSQNVSV